MLALLALAQAVAVSGAVATPDLSAYATTAQIPRPCSSAPAGDTLNGSVGAAGCYTQRDDTRPTAVQRAMVTTDGTGAWSLVFARGFGATPVVTVKPVMPTGRGDCGVAAVSPTGASGSCWTYQSVTVSVLGATLNPFATAASGVPVMIVAGQPTQ